MSSNVVQIPVGRDPVWLNEFEYLVRWKGRVRRVDIRKLKPVIISGELFRDSSCSFNEVIKRLRW